jgi:Na+-driven multidrug efflux pump
LTNPYLINRYLGIVRGLTKTLLRLVLLNQLNITSQALPIVRLYAHILFAGAPLLIGYNFLGSVYRGVGGSPLFLMVVIFVAIFPIILDLVFIRFLDMEMENPVWTTNMAHAISLVPLIIFLIKRDITFTFFWLRLHWNGLISSNTSEIRFPIGFKEGLYCGRFLVLTSFVNSFNFSPYAQANHINTFIHAPMESLRYGFSAFASQNLGFKRIGIRLHTTRRLDIVILVTITAIVWIFAFPLANFFTDSQKVTLLHVYYLRVVSLCYNLYALSEITSKIVMGNSQTKIMIISCITAMWLVRILLAYVLSKFFKMNILGVWLSIPSGWVVALDFNYYVYARKKWKTFLASHV